jgi:hypothetical protein
MRTDSSPLAATREEPEPCAPLPDAGGRNAPPAPAARGHALLVVAAVVLVVAATLFANLGRYPLWEPDEARHAEIAREMAARDSWLLPTLNGRPYHDKPVMYYWLTAAAYRVWARNGGGSRRVGAGRAADGRRGVLVGAGRVGHGGGGSVRADARHDARVFALGRFGDLNMLLTLFVTVGVLGVHRWEHRADTGVGSWLPPGRPDWAR